MELRDWAGPKQLHNGWVFKPSQTVGQTTLITLPGHFQNWFPIPDVMVHPSTWEAEAGRLPQVQAWDT